MTVLRKIAHVFWRSVSETVFVWLHEASNAVRDDAVWVFILLVPIGYPLLYSYIYNNEVVRDIPVAVVDMDNSPESRDYIRKLDASENALVQTRPADLATAQEEMREQKVYGIVYIPADFSRNISTMQSATVYLFSDVTTLIYYRQLAIANTGVSLAMNAKIKAIRGGGTTARQDELVQSPIKYEQVDIFNPQLGIATFLLPAVLMLILQQTMFLGIGITAGTMREKNGFRLYAPVARHAGGTFEIVLGRSLCYLPIYVANSFWVLGITPMIFHFERLSRFPDLVAFLLPYLLAVCFLGQCISHFIKTRESCMMIILFSSLFFLFVSGLSWPWPAVPTFWKVLGVMAPSTLGINGFVRMTNEGATLSQVMPEYIGLWIQVVVYFCLAMFTTKLDIRESCHAFVRSHRRGRHHAAVKDGQNEPETAIATE